MRISAKGHYAVRAMLDMVTQPQNRPVPLSNIAGRQGISLHFLEQLFVKLRRGNLVKSVRGPGGGYLFAKKPGDITIGSILRQVGEEISISACVDPSDSGENGCEKSNDCVASLLWRKLSMHISEILDTITLEELCREKTEGKGQKKQRAEGRKDRGQRKSRG